MANERGGMEGASVDWSFAASQAFLPPRSPLFSGGQSTNQENNSFFSNWPKLPQPGTNRRHHQRTPSTSFLPQTPAWVDDLLNDTSDVPPVRSTHRRSSSDSMAFLDGPLQHVRIHGITEEEELDAVGMDPRFSRGSRALDKLDEEPFMSKVAESGSLQKYQNGIAHSNAGHQVERRAPIETSSAPSDQDSGNASSMDDKRARGVGQSGNDSEVQSAFKSEQTSLHGGQPEPSNLTDATLDPKRAKRILANRQSAQRSRVRKLQYISELERTVNVLQEEVSALSPQVTYLDRHRILLNVDNSAMKQRIAALAQEKLFKDAHNEALKNELHRLRQLYQQQQQKQAQQSIARQVSSQQFDILASPQVELKENDGVSDVSTQCMEEMYKDSEADLLRGHALLRSPIMKPIGSNSHCSNAGDKGKDVHIHNMPGLAQIHADF
ncbi:hypothetical protein GOP47_0019815 [Adiantum capillus-veneris]|uniref:BZIP domain-containing protein n=1 Tax=Adiantum capillus-veneris TaxID=13818 RepID=A0A9D4UC13_ADICA|nr:hypothetical protein GOP47_0019815 [Adiantum capillus-veneris]